MIKKLIKKKTLLGWYEVEILKLHIKKWDFEIFLQEILLYLQ